MGRPTMRERDENGRKYVHMLVYPETKNLLKSQASLLGKKLAPYMEEISKKEAEKVFEEQKSRRRFGGDLF